MIRILLVEDDYSFRHLVQDILADIDDIQFLGVAENGYQAIELLNRRTLPQVIITDLNMPILNGLELLFRIKALGVDIPVLVMSMHSTESHFIRVMEAGARGFVSKEDVFELQDHIRTVYRGEIAVSTAMRQYRQKEN